MVCAEHSLPCHILAAHTRLMSRVLGILHKTFPRKTYSPHRESKYVFVLIKTNILIYGLEFASDIETTECGLPVRVVTGVHGGYQTRDPGQFKTIHLFLISL